MILNSERSLNLLGKGIKYGSKVCIYDMEFSIIEVDDGYAEIVGVLPEQKEEMIGLTMPDCIHPDDAEKVAQELYGYEDKPEKYDCKYRLKKKEGEYIWVRDIGEVLEKDGKQYFYSTIIDINQEECGRLERKAADETMLGGMAYLIIGKDEIIAREVNDRYLYLMGEEEGDKIFGKNVFPEDIEKVQEHFFEKSKRHEKVNCEFRMRNKKRGNVSWYRIVGSYYATLDEGEEYLCILMDITKMRNMQFELAKLQERSRVGMKNTADLMFSYEMDKQKIRLYGQQYMQEDSILCVEDNTILPYRDLLTKNDLIYKGDRGILRSFIRNDDYRYDNIRMLTKNKETGKKYYDFYEFFANKVYENGKVTKIIGYVKKLSYKSIPVSTKQELHQIFDEQIIRDYSFVLKIDVSTEAFVPYFIDDYMLKDYPGNRYYETFLFWWSKRMVAAEDQQEINFFLSLEQMLRILHSGEPQGYHFCRVRGKDNKYRHKICSFSFYGTDINTIILVVRDVHAMRSQEEYLSQIEQKMITDVMGTVRKAENTTKRFMDYVLKEFSTPIQTLKELVGNGFDEKNVYEIVRCSDYLGEILHTMAEYGQLGASNAFSMKYVDLCHLCEEVCEMGKRLSVHMGLELRDNISINPAYRYETHEGRFRDMLMNLLGNSLRFAPDNTEIRVFVKEVNVEEEQCQISIVLEDHGAIVDEKLYDRRPERQGGVGEKDRILALGDTGHSLSLSSKLAESLGGTVEFQQGVMRNCIIKINIPMKKVKEEYLLDDEIQYAQKNMEEEKPLRGQGVLLIEKQKGEATLTAPLLRMNGAIVYIAYTGEEALSLLNKFNYGTISVVLVDHELDDMNSYEFAKKLKGVNRQFEKEIPIIEMLEGIQSGDTHMAMISGMNAQIQKPIHVNKFTRILKALQGDL